MLEADDLPLPRPLGRRRRPRLPHEGRDRRARRRTDPIVRVRAQLLDARRGRRASSTRSTRAPTQRVAAAVDVRGRRAPSRDVDQLAAGMYAARQRRAVRAHAAGQPVRRARAGLRRRAWAHERDRRAAGAPVAATEVMTYREALRLALREELARDERVFLMGEEVGVFDGAYKVTAGLLDEFGARPRARHADLRGGLRRRRRRRGDARRAPGRRDHDDQLPARRDGPGRQPRGQDRRDVRRRGALPAGDPHAQRRRQPAHRPALAVVRRLVRRTSRASRSSRPRRPPTRRAC